MRRRALIYISTVVFLIINGIGLYFGNVVYEKACKLKTASILSVYNIYKYTFDDQKFYDLLKEDIEIKSDFGYSLYGTYINNPKKGTKDTVIILHGLRDNRWSSMKYASMYIDKGFNVLVYDSRGHGESGGDSITYGYYEKYDLDRMVDFVVKKNGNATIGVHGESMGAATALLHSEMNEKNKRVTFYVADCAFSDLSEVFSLRAKDYIKTDNTLIEKSIVLYTSTVSLFKSGFSFYDVSPINAIKNVTTPIMFIHGGKDAFIPSSMSEDMFKIKKGVKDIYIAPNAAHATSFVTDKGTYIDRVYKFINKVRLIHS